MFAVCVRVHVQGGLSCEAGVWVECDLPVVAAGLPLSAQAL